METVAFIYAADLSEYAFDTDLPIGESPFELLLSKARALPGVEKIVLLTKKEPEYFSDFLNEKDGSVRQGVYRTASDILSVLVEEIEEGQNGFFLWGDTPLIDSNLSRQMYERHVRYFASYTFADGYPQGLAPEILRAETLTRLKELAERQSVDISRTMIFDVVQKDINAFDLETEVAPKDMRLYRVLLAADTKRNYLLLKSVMEKGGDNVEAVMRIIEEHQEVLRTLPAYLQVQITEACPQKCAYCPYPQFVEDIVPDAGGNNGDITKLKGELDLERWEKLLDDAERCCDDIVVGIGLWGEPALHSRIAELVERVLTHPKFRLLIETSGVGWRAEDLRKIGEIADERIDWIISLDAATEETYRCIRGSQWGEANACISMLRELFSDDRIHVQAVRIEENEKELEHFYRGWKEEGLPLIVQKYDHFCGVLPDKKITDLSPLTRYPCWHIKRDVTVLIDGTVRLCREDLKGEYPQGNVFEEGLETVWEKMEPYYLRHVSGELPSLCESCDEYYTFNF